MWFSPGTPASSTTKTGRHDIAESGVKHQKSNQINHVLGFYTYFIFNMLYVQFLNRLYDITYLVWGSLHLITCSKIENIPYNIIFTTKLNDSSILITIISWDNLSLANEYVGDITIPTYIIRYNQCCSRQISQSDCSIHIKLNYFVIHWHTGVTFQMHNVFF